MEAEPPASLDRVAAGHDGEGPALSHGWQCAVLHNVCEVETKYIETLLGENARWCLASAVGSAKRAGSLLGVPLEAAVSRDAMPRKRSKSTKGAKSAKAAGMKSDW